MKHVFRFFIAQSLASGDRVRLEQGDAFHAARVLRLKPGDALEVADSGGKVFRAAVTGVDGGVEVEVAGELDRVAPGLALTVVQALPKGRKLDLIVEKLSEVGVARLLPVFSDKSAVKPPLSPEKLERWRRIAKAAASQSRRSGIMAVEPPVVLADWLADTRSPPLVLATEREGLSLGEAFLGTGATTLVVGPEAGFSARELEQLAAAGAHFAGLGRQILRTETAALVASVIIMHRAGVLG